MNEYNQALNEVAKYLSSPVGFSDHDSPKEDSKIIIRQNNTILQLLIQVLEKLNSVESNKDIVLSSSGIVSASRGINSEKWIYLTASPEETNSSR
jgi:hypothetical protein